MANRIKPFIDVSFNHIYFIKKSRNEQAEEFRSSQKCVITHTKKMETIRPNKWIRRGSIIVVVLKKINVTVFALPEKRY